MAATYYEIREYADGHAMTPTDRGILVKLCKTFAEAMDEATKMHAAGRNVYVCQSEGWVS